MSKVQAAIKHGGRGGKKWERRRKGQYIYSWPIIPFFCISTRAILAESDLCVTLDCIAAGPEVVPSRKVVVKAHGPRKSSVPVPVVLTKTMDEIFGPRKSIVIESPAIPAVMVTSPTMDVLAPRSPRKPSIPVLVATYSPSTVVAAPKVAVAPPRKSGVPVPVVGKTLEQIFSPLKSRKAIAVPSMPRLPSRFSPRTSTPVIPNRRFLSLSLSLCRALVILFIKSLLFWQVR